MTASSQAGLRRPAIIVGLRAEARIAQRLGWTVITSGGSVTGAELALERLAGSGVSALVSFGLAGGLNPSLQPGVIMVPAIVRADGMDYDTDPGLNRLLGGTTSHALLGSRKIAATAEEKRLLRGETGADAVDLESGAAARAASALGLPFAALRAICDPAERTLLPAALAALDQRGVISLGRVVGSVLRQPGQIPGLLMLARDAAKARRALLRRVRAIQG